MKAHIIQLIPSKILKFCFLMLAFWVSYNTTMAQSGGPTFTMTNGTVAVNGQNVTNPTNEKSVNTCFSVSYNNPAYIISTNKKYLFYVTTSEMGIKELIFSDPSNTNATSSRTVWSQNFPQQIDCLKPEGTGNFVAYAPGGIQVWASGTNYDPAGPNGHIGGDAFLLSTTYNATLAKFMIHDDGDSNMFNGLSQNVWHTGTCGGVLNGCGGVGAPVAPLTIEP